MNKLSQNPVSCAHCGMACLLSIPLQNPAGGQFAFCCRGCREIYRLWHDLPETNPPPFRRFLRRFLTLKRRATALTAE